MTNTTFLLSRSETAPSQRWSGSSQIGRNPFRKPGNTNPFRTSILKIEDEDQRRSTLFETDSTTSRVTGQESNVEDRARRMSYETNSGQSRQVVVENWVRESIASPTSSASMTRSETESEAIGFPDDCSETSATSVYTTGTNVRSLEDIMRPKPARTFERDLLLDQVRAVREMWSNRDFSSAEKIIIDILENKSLEAHETAFWTLRRAFVTQMEGKWEESLQLVTESSRIMAYTNGRSQQIQAEALYQLDEFETARAVGLEALRLLEKEDPCGSSKELFLFEQREVAFKTCMELMARIAIALHRPIEMKFYQNRAGVEYISEPAKAQEERASSLQTKQNRGKEEVLSKIDGEAIESSRQLQTHKNTFWISRKPGKGREPGLVPREVSDWPFNSLKNQIPAIASGELLQDNPSDAAFWNAFEKAFKDLNNEKINLLLSDKDILTKRKSITCIQHESIRKCTPLYFALKYNNVECTLRLIELGASANEAVIDRFPRSHDPCHTVDTAWEALSIAAKYGSIDAARVLLEHGAKINGSDVLDLALTKKVTGTTPLHQAIKHGTQEIAELLLENGAKPDVEDGAGMLPLCIAAEKGYTKTVQLLLDKGANIQGCNICTGNTPLHYASKSGNVDTVRLLLSRGANFKTLNRQKQRPIKLAPNDKVRATIKIFQNYDEDPCRIS